MSLREMNPKLGISLSVRSLRVGFGQVNAFTSDGRLHTVCPLYQDSFLYMTLSSQFLLALSNLVPRARVFRSVVTAQRSKALDEI